MWCFINLISYLFLNSNFRLGRYSTYGSLSHLVGQALTFWKRNHIPWPYQWDNLHPPRGKNCTSSSHTFSSGRGPSANEKKKEKEREHICTHKSEINCFKCQSSTYKSKECINKRVPMLRAKKLVWRFKRGILST